MKNTVSSLPEILYDGLLSRGFVIQKFHQIPNYGEFWEFNNHLRISSWMAKWGISYYCEMHSTMETDPSIDFLRRIDSMTDFIKRPKLPPTLEDDLNDWM